MPALHICEGVNLKTNDRKCKKLRRFFARTSLSPGKNPGVNNDINVLGSSLGNLMEEIGRKFSRSSRLNLLQLLPFPEVNILVRVQSGTAKCISDNNDHAAGGVLSGCRFL